MVKGFLTVDVCRERLAEGVETFDTVDLRAMDFMVSNNDFFATYNKRDTQLGKDAVGDLLDIARVPVTFLRKDCEDAKLRKSILDYCKKENDQKLSIARRGDIVNRIYPAVTDPVGVLDVFDTIKALSDKWVGATFTSNGTSRIKLLTEARAEPAKKAGDVTQAGLFLEIGRDIRIAAYLHTLVCSNGMKRTQFEHEFATMATREMLPLVRFNGRRCLEFAQQNYLHEFMSTSEQTIEDPAVMIRRLGQRQRLPLKVISDLIGEVPALPRPTSYYDVIFMITERARDLAADGNFRNADRLEDFADAITEESHGQICSRCHGPL